MLVKSLTASKRSSLIIVGTFGSRNQLTTSLSSLPGYIEEVAMEEARDSLSSSVVSASIIRQDAEKRDEAEGAGEMPLVHRRR